MTYLWLVFINKSIQKLCISVIKLVAASSLLKYSLILKENTCREPYCNVIKRGCGRYLVTFQHRIKSICQNSAACMCSALIECELVRMG